MIGVLQSIIERCSSTLDTNGAYNCNGVVDKQREDCGWAGGDGEDEDQYRCCTVLYCTVLYCTVQGGAGQAAAVGRAMEARPHRGNVNVDN